jgi:uncharacterized protein YndB with AHSA1/START domain
MTDHKPSTTEPAGLSLLTRRTIHASVERVFEVWTEPAHLRKWWGPEGVTCIGAEVDLRAGGHYRIGNQLPDGTEVWIVGEFELVEPPHKLIYSWRIGPESRISQRVTVRFEPRDGGTEIVIVHERIPDAISRDMHEKGWHGCLDGLAEYLAVE